MKESGFCEGKQTDKQKTCKTPAKTHDLLSDFMSKLVKFL